MKILISYLFFIILTINLRAQCAYDHINYDQIFILKSGSSLKSKVSDLTNLDVIEQQFGPKYKIQKQFKETEQESYCNIVFNSGLKLSIPENKKLNINFFINSNKFCLQLSNGSKIKVGMTSNELKAIFPKSFAKRTAIENIKGQEGKTGIVVYFSRTINNKIFLEDHWITFILNAKNGKLEEFYTYEPL